MELFNYLSQNIDRVKFDVRNGIIPCVLMKHYQIYSRYDYYRKSGENKCAAINFTGIDFRYSERKIYDIIKRMEQNVS